MTSKHFYKEYIIPCWIQWNNLIQPLTTGFLLAPAWVFQKCLPCPRLLTHRKWVSRWPLQTVLHWENNSPNKSEVTCHHSLSSVWNEAQWSRGDALDCGDEAPGRIPKITGKWWEGSVKNKGSILPHDPLPWAEAAQALVQVRSLLAGNLR